MKIALFGASGRTGKEIMLQSLIKGYQVQALVRRIDSIDLRNEKLSLVEGDVLDAAAVEKVIDGADAVMVAIGARSAKEAQVHSLGTRHIVDAMQKRGLKRIIVVSSAGLFGSKDSNFIFGCIIRPIFLRKIFEAKLKELEILEQSALEWILVRPAGLIDGQKTGKYHITEDRPTGKNITCADVAEFMLGQLNGSKYIRKMPIISY